MNTMLLYLYRDASNYKKHGKIILRGRFTPNQLDRLKLTLSDGDSFVAQSVGIPSVALWEGDFPANEDDHPFHEFGNLMLTADEPTHSDTVEEMVTKFEWASQEGWKHEEVNPDPLLSEYRKVCEMEWIPWKEFLASRSKQPEVKA